MGKKRAQLVSKAAFEQAFVESEILMRKALGKMIEAEIKIETNPQTIVGLKKALTIVVGEEVK